MFNKNKKTEINKTLSTVLEIARFCAQITIQKNLYFTQVNIVESKGKENLEEIRIFSIEILFLTLWDEEKNELRMNCLETHPKISGKIILRKRKNENLSLKRIDLTTTIDLKKNEVSSFSYSDDPKLTEPYRWSLWISEEQRDKFANFIFSFETFR